MEKLNALSSARPVERIVRPFRAFIEKESSGGIVLMACTLLALGMANSPLGAAYDHFWHTGIGITIGDFSLHNSLLHWINDGLMVVFFFLVGLEIKREIVVGELASVRKAALPFMAALGGMIVPAGIYAALNAGTPAISGWGVPMATDIAFALGVLALLGRGVPTGLFVFLAALAIVDDLGAVLVIAVFYTEQIHWVALGFGGAMFAGMIILNLAGVRSPIPYGVLGIATWVAFLQSGVHATIAGVLAAVTIPVRTLLDPDHFLESSREILDHFEGASENLKEPVIVNEHRAASVVALEDACERVQAPLQRFEHDLLPWVTFLILPIFALGNAGVSLSGDVLSALVSPLSLGIIFGLVLGKQIGITLFSWIAVKIGLAALPEGVTWRHIYGTSWLAGIGFTMSLFIAMLAFGEGQALTDAKTAILVASLIAGTVGYLLLRSTPSKASGTATDAVI